MSFGYKVLGFGSGGGATSPYLVATGGTITCSGNDKIHTFTGPGTFTVCSAGTCAANNLVSYMVVAGGGGGGGNHGGGAGAGGFREVESPVTPYTASPLEGYATEANRITVTATGYPITAGGGGTGSPKCVPNATAGSDSIFSCITSAGGAKGASEGCGPNPHADLDGGSGGGGTYDTSPRAGGSGNTPPVSPSQGSDGGTGIAYAPGASGGGGGATEVGAAGVPATSGRGGAGATTEITDSPVAYAGGAGGAATGYGVAVGAASPCGTGGAGSPGPGNAGCAGTTYKGGGGGGGYAGPPTGGSPGGNGGSGVVIIRYKFQ